MLKRLKLVLSLVGLGLAYRIEDLEDENSFYESPNQGYLSGYNPFNRQDNVAEQGFSLIPVFLTTFVASSVMNLFLSFVWTNQDTRQDLFNPEGCGVAEPAITRRQRQGKKRRNNNRITFGKEATENQFPWQCQILSNDGQPTWCQATLISCEGLLVTSASCLQPRGTYGAIHPAFSFAEAYNPNLPLHVSCGGHNIFHFQDGERLIGFPAPMDPNERRETILTASHIKIHPEFRRNATNMEHDIALIKVDAFPCKKKEIWPVCLPETDKFKNTANWKTTLVTGWGRDESYTETGILRYARVEVLPDSTCQAEWKSLELASGVSLPQPQSNMVCAKALTGAEGGNPCKGDNGGPLVTKTTGDAGFSLVGVTSFPSCGFLLSQTIARHPHHPPVPSVFTEVTNYVDFIKKYGPELALL